MLLVSGDLCIGACYSDVSIVCPTWYCCHLYTWFRLNRVETEKVLLLRVQLNLCKFWGLPMIILMRYILFTRHPVSFCIYLYLFSHCCCQFVHVSFIWMVLLSVMCPIVCRYCLHDKDLLSLILFLKFLDFELIDG